MTRSLRERHGKFLRDLEQERTKHVSTAKHDNKSTDIITSYMYNDGYFVYINRHLSTGILVKDYREQLTTSGRNAEQGAVYLLRVVVSFDLR